jgi:heme exporter protein CcmD
MDFSAAHSNFVVVSYVLTALCLFALCLYVLNRDRAVAKKLKHLDEKTDA